MNDNSAGHTTARRAARDQLIALLGRDPQVQEESEDATTSVIVAYSLGGTIGVRGEWHLHEDGRSLSVELSGLSPAQARQIAALLYRRV